MSFFPDLKQVQEALNSAQTIFIVLPAQVNFDKTAAALAFFLSLKKAGKQVFIGCSAPMTVEFSSLVGVDKIQSKLGGRNLLISFDYLEDSIEKVSYNIENDKFNLTIQPKQGFAPLSTDKVHYGYTGGRADLILIMGAGSLNDLGDLYQANKGLFEQAKTWDFDISSRQKTFAQKGFFDSQSAAFCETIAGMLAKLKLPVDGDIAVNLFRGLLKATRNFSSPKVGAATFEAAAFCLRSGAKRPQKKIKTPLKPMPTSISAQKTPEIPQSDWLEPKIYKGATRI